MRKNSRKVLIAFACAIAVMALVGVVPATAAWFQNSPTPGYCPKCAHAAAMQAKTRIQNDKHIELQKASTTAATVTDETPVMRVNDPVAAAPATTEVLQVAKQPDGAPTPMVLEVKKAVAVTTETAAPTCERCQHAQQDCNCSEPRPRFGLGLFRRFRDN